MAVPISILLLLCVCLTASYAPISAWKLTPPLGYSIHMRTKAVGGVHVYTCADGDWLPDSAFATLLDMANPGSEVGTYSFVHLPRQPRYVGTWVLLNSRGDATESGSPVSLVSGKRIVSFSSRPGHLPEFLAEASLHESNGAASLISYIARFNTNGGLPPSEGYCQQNATIQVPFSADFYLWKHDLVPPKVPSQLQVDSHQRFVESFFAKGVVKYAFNGEEWEQRKMMGKLYNMAGGTQVGSYAHEAGEERQWNLSNPHGFALKAHNVCEAVTVETSSLPWALMAVTSSSGNTSMLGPYSYIQMVSTHEGLAPRISKTTIGRVWKSPFSAIFWFYCNASFR